MKKLFLLLVSYLLLGASVEAKCLIGFTSHIIDNTPVGNNMPRTPIEVPLVYIEDNTLSFEVNHPDYTLIIKDEDGYVVYTTTVFSTDTEVILPSTLSGDYEVNLVMGSWLFTGWIEL